jgi:flagellar biosynthesis protein
MARSKLSDLPRAEALARTYSAAEGVDRSRGLMARDIIARALDAGMYAHATPDLVALLMDVDMDSRSPPELYTAVAELLTWLHRVDHGSGG